MQRISKAVMRKLIAEHGNDDTPRVYTHWNPLVGELFWRSHDRMLALSRAGRRRRALDFGGGNGVLLPTLSKLFDEVVCVDLNAAIAQEVVRIHNLLNVEVVSGDIFTLNLPDGHFDVVTAASVLEHILDLPKLAVELRRLLCDGGELLVAAPSENLFYEIGRKLVGYTKPWDHHHDGDYIIDRVSAELALSRKEFWPINWRPLAVFYMMSFVKETAGEAKS